MRRRLVPERPAPVTNARDLYVGGPHALPRARGPDGSDEAQLSSIHALQGGPLNTGTCEPIKLRLHRRSLRANKPLRGVALQGNPEHRGGDRSRDSRLLR